MHNKEKIQVQLAQNERTFIKVYNDFWTCNLISNNERSVFITLKSFLAYGTDSGTVFPSLETLAEQAKLNIKTVIKNIKSLIDKGIIKKIRQGLTKSNLYILNDTPEIWKSKTVEEMKENATHSIPYSTEELLQELEKREAIEIIDRYDDEKVNIKERECEIGVKKESATTNHSHANSKTKNSLRCKTSSRCDLDYNITSEKCQEKNEKYSLDYLRELYDYNVICSHIGLENTENIINIIYNTLNSSKKVIHIGCGNYKKEIVVSKLLKLTYSEIEFVIKQYNKQKAEIKHPESYILTQLYKAKEQHSLYMQNLFNTTYEP